MVGSRVARLAARCAGVRDEDKARIEGLQGELSLASGKKPSRQEVLRRMVEFAARHGVEFVSEAAWRPPPASAVRRWMDAPEDLGDWSTADIDSIVYGDGA